MFFLHPFFFFFFILSFLALKTDKRVHHRIPIIISLQQVLVLPHFFPTPSSLLKFSSALCGHFASLLQQLPFSFSFSFSVCVCVHLTAPVRAPGLPVELKGARVVQRELLIRRFYGIKKNRSAE